jgi:hypothetical protein
MPFLRAQRPKSLARWTSKAARYAHPPSRCVRAPFSYAYEVAWVRNGVFGSGPECWSFIRREDELVAAEFTAFPEALVQIQNASGFGPKLWVSRKYPAVVLPRADGILVQPSPDGGVTERGGQTGGADLPAAFRHAPARKGHTKAAGEFTGDGLNLYDQFWGKNPASARGAGSLPGRPSVFRRSVFASG